MMKNPNLMQQLEHFEFPPNFLSRLCEENHWSTRTGQDVLAEYKRFLYLAQVSPNPVTPSVLIDEAWHLHLIHTHSYWQDLCGKVLDRPLHHTPTEGGPVETAKFNDWYQRTIELYRQEFGTEPPPLIWPQGKRQQRWRLPLFSLVPLCLISTPLPFLILALVAGVIFLIARASKHSKASGDGGGCSSFDMGSGGDSCDGSSGDGCGDGGSGCGGGGCGGGGCGGGD